MVPGSAGGPPAGAGRCSAPPAGGPPALPEREACHETLAWLPCDRHRRQAPHPRGHCRRRTSACSSSGERFELVDTREESEFARGHLPRARHLSKGIIERDIETAIPDPATPIVLYCGGGFRSALAADNLQKMGYTQRRLDGRRLARVDGEGLPDGALRGGALECGSLLPLWGGRGTGSLTSPSRPTPKRWQATALQNCHSSVNHCTSTRRLRSLSCPPVPPSRDRRFRRATRSSSVVAFEQGGAHGLGALA